MRHYLTKHHTLIAFGMLFTLLALWLQLGEKLGRTIIDRLDHLAYDVRLNLPLPATRAVDSKV